MRAHVLYAIFISQDMCVTQAQQLKSHVCEKCTVVHMYGHSAFDFYTNVSFGQFVRLWTWPAACKYINHGCFVYCFVL